jgi:hypothetical protein
MSEQHRALLREVLSAASCSHPIRLVGRTVNLATGELRDSSLRVPCKDRRAAVCPACSYLYKADAWILVSSGIGGGKGLPESIDQHPRLFVTLTAPGFGAVHRRIGSGRCHPEGPKTSCRHGQRTWCDLTHAEDDILLGHSLCPDCFDCQGAVLWNATASRLWNGTIIRLRQAIGAAGGVPTSRASEVARISYLKVAEVQRRGLIHFHVILRADGPEGPDAAPPPWLTSELLTRTLHPILKATSVESPNRARVGWGTQFDIVDISSASSDGRRVASYLAKYSTKTTDGTTSLARRFRSRAQIERAAIGPHAKRLVLAAWDLHPRFPELRLRDHAHTFGFRGQLITKSRAYSTTFGALRAARTEHMKSRSNSDPVAGTFSYAGRGYSDPRGSELAEMLHELIVDQRREASRSRSGSRPHSQVIPESIPNARHPGGTHEEI